MTDKKGRDPAGRFISGNQMTTKHGGEGAVKQLQHGRELTGLAAQAELAVASEVARDGRYSLVMRNARRLQAAADLYWNALATAAEAGDLDKMDAYVKRYGWLSGCAMRGWAQVRAEEPMGGLVYDDEIERLKDGA